MSSSLEINGKLLCPIKEAAREVPYSRDYVTRLARERKILATHIGRQWFVDLDSLKSYVESANLEQEIRKKQLSEERKRERELREVAESQHSIRVRKASSLHTRAMVAASLVLGFGLLSGAATYELIAGSHYSTTQVARTYETQLSQIPTSDLGVSPEEVQDKRDVELGHQVVQQMQIESMGDIESGVLLLPLAENYEEVSELFSDRVVVRTKTDGTTSVVKVDMMGNEIGNEIPFVTIPVESEDGSE